MEGNDKDMRIIYSEGIEGVIMVRWEFCNDVFVFGFVCFYLVLFSYFDGSFDGF